MPAGETLVVHSRVQVADRASPGCGARTSAGRSRRCTATWTLRYSGTSPSTGAGQVRPGKSTASMRMRMPTIIPPTSRPEPTGREAARASLCLGGEFGGQSALATDQQGECGTDHCLFQVVPEGGTWRPFFKDEREAAGDEKGVERFGRREVEHGGDLVRIERRHDHLDATLVEGATVGVQLLHHRDVRADEDEEYGHLGQCPIE